MFRNITVADYIEYLKGRAVIVPPSHFEFWAEKATSQIDFRTSNRLNAKTIFEEFKDFIIPCVCELAEYYYSTDGSAWKSSESVSGHSVTFKSGADKEIIFRRLGDTGLLFRGGNTHVSKRCI